MVEVVPDSDWQSLQYFISHSPWDTNNLINQISQDTNALLGGQPNSCLILDESCFEKKGKKSVGVARQWNGRLGKVDNCQVGVFVALGCHDRATIIDTRLFLPEAWTNDKDRCLKSGIPEVEIKHRTKPELALELVNSARTRGLDYNWVACDGLYGNTPEFLRELDQIDQIFVADVHCDQTIYLDDPKPYVPARKSKRGRIPTQLKSVVEGTRIDKWAKSQAENVWEEMILRNSTKGLIRKEVLHRRVWLWDGDEKQAQNWHLVVSRDPISKGQYKFSISNACAETSKQRLAYMQNQRFWIERALEDCKSEVGMADYQVRGWVGWHHHIAMVMLAQLFMLETRLKNKTECELLSCADIQTWLSHFLPRRDVTKQEVLRQMQVRHKQGAAAIESHRKRQSYESD